MKLHEILAYIDVSYTCSAANKQINNIKLDSRKVQKGDLFIALPGSVTDGRKYIHEAIKKGAIAILAEESCQFSSDTCPIPIVNIKELSKYLGRLANYFYQSPSKTLKVIGITGTNGKTSVCQYIAELLQYQAPCGLIGTLGIGFYGNLKNSTHTTPDCITLHETLASFKKQGAHYVSIEISSHALMQNRVSHVHFDTAIFTNLSQDHLDYHKTMSEYWATKLRLFMDYDPKHIIINLDDPYGRQLLRYVSKREKILGYTIKPKQDMSCEKLVLQTIAIEKNKIFAMLKTPFGDTEIEAPVIGCFNLSNILAAICASVVYGCFNLEDISKRVQKLSTIFGRMQHLGGDEQPLVIVDYAHTPDALAKVLATLRLRCSGKLWCLFGCGGNRDKTKRSKMLSSALEFSDKVIITKDNPREEDPKKIIEDTLKGHHNTDKITIELDRKKAIYEILRIAHIEDIILIAGKGHENYQLIGTSKLPFSDISVAKKALALRNKQC